MWQTELTRIVRILLQDLDASKYSDDSLQELIIVAAQFVYNDLRVSSTYTADVDEMSLSPDPTDRDANTRNDAYINLICFRAACIVDYGDASSAAKRAIIAKSGPSSYDLTGIAKAKLQLLDKGYCAVYEHTLLEYRVEKIGSAGAAIMTPIRLYANQFFINNE